MSLFHVPKKRKEKRGGNCFWSQYVLDGLPCLWNSSLDLLDTIINHRYSTCLRPLRVPTHGKNRVQPVAVVTTMAASPPFPNRGKSPPHNVASRLLLTYSVKGPRSAWQDVANRMSPKEWWYSPSWLGSILRASLAV